MPDQVWESPQKWSVQYDIMGAERAIKACGITSRKYRDIIPSYGTHKDYIEAEFAKTQVK